MKKATKKTKGNKNENIRIEPRGRGGGGFIFSRKKGIFWKRRKKKNFKAWEESEKRCGCRHDASG